MMRKLVSLLLIVAIFVSLCACGKSEATKNCEELIAQIGEVSLDSEDAICAAEDAYDALSSEEKDQIEAETAQKLKESRKEFEALVEQAELEAKLNAVTDLIDAIGTVTTESEPAIAAAEAAFAALSQKEKDMIKDHAETLNAAREAYIVAVKESHVATVAEHIDAIGTVTLDSKDAIDLARELYDVLTDEEKAMLTNYGVLEAAEAEYTALKEAEEARIRAEKDKIVKEYSSKFEIDEDKVDKLTWYMHDDMPDYIDIRSYIIPYIGVKNGNPWIVIRYNYTEDDWIFWENMKIVVDDETYFKYVGYFNTVRDNDGGVVWEWYDEALDYNQSLDSEELVMLQKIADSEETIIRFEGDNYYYDLTVSKTDKAIIRDVLTLYGALLG